MKKYKIKAKKGNEVKIISGKYKGKIGIIKEILYEKNKVIIDKINIQTKHIKVKQSEEKGIIKQVEGPIHYSNIKTIKTDK
uniref:Large ribosomal subunit protein uL24c n=1 Tax=Laurenciella marilzae TaxID=1413812 RepID=A0A1Z1M1V6_9FLOR|nr:ribosomal protein L24 [Laurenciella marilzae]ARW59841.1 ribosomal protein L24 [Laurenciella marilzae]